MTIFDIMGPIMVGPSSSHTAGAVRIGLIARKLLGSAPIGAELTLHGSFAATGSGHGTDRALSPACWDWSLRSSHSPELRAGGRGGAFLPFPARGAQRRPPQFRDRSVPWTRICTASRWWRPLWGAGAFRSPLWTASAPSFPAKKNTLIIRNEDRVGEVAAVSNTLSAYNVNIASMQLYRNARGSDAIITIESDEPITPATVERIRAYPGIKSVTYLDVGGGGE